MPVYCCWTTAVPSFLGFSTFCAPRRVLERWSTFFFLLEVGKRAFVLLFRRHVVQSSRLPLKGFDLFSWDLLVQGLLEAHLLRGYTGCFRLCQAGGQATLHCSLISTTAEQAPLAAWQRQVRAMCVGSKALSATWWG